MMLVFPSSLNLTSVPWGMNTFSVLAETHGKDWSRSFHTRRIFPSLPADQEIGAEQQSRSGNIPTILPPSQKAAEGNTV